MLPYLKTLDIDNIYDGGDMIVVEGIAADTSRDIVGDVASRNFLTKLSADLVNRPVYYNHNYKMPQIGVVLDTKLVENGNKLWAKAGIYKSQTNENILKGLTDGSLRYFSVGAIGKKVFQQVMNNLPTRVFDDGYGQELTITGVPINPTAAFKVAKSHGSDPDGYNIDDLSEFVKSVNEMGITDYITGEPINDILEYRNNIAQQMEESFMKGNSGMLDSQIWGGQGHTSGQWDNLNKPAAKGPGMSDLRGVGGQLVPSTLQQMIHKAWDEATSMEDFVARVEFVFAKGYGYDHLNGTGRGPGQFTSWGPGSEPAVNARDIAMEIVNIIGKPNNSPNYGTHPWDAEYLRNNMPKVAFKERGYDDTFVDESVGRAGPESLGPVGQGKNPGVHPLDQDFLTQGLQQLPPAAKSNGFVHSGMTSVRKAEDLLEDEKFMNFIHATKYLYKRSMGPDESYMTFVHRLLHERSETEPDSDFRKAIDGEIIKALNLNDYDNPSLEDTAILEHILDDFNHADVMHKCMSDSRCSFSTLYKSDLMGEDEYEKGGKPPWLNKDDDEEDDEKDDKDEKKGKGKGDCPMKKSDDKDEDDEEDDEKEDKDKKEKKKFPFMKKSDDKDEDDEDEEEDDDEDKKEEMKKSFVDDDDEFEIDEDSRLALKAMVSDMTRAKLENDQADAVEMQKGYVASPASPANVESVGGLQRLAQDDFQRGILSAIEHGISR